MSLIRYSIEEGRSSFDTALYGYENYNYSILFTAICLCHVVCIGCHATFSHLAV